MLKIFLQSILLISILFINSFANNNGNTKIKSFSKAKKLLKNKIYNTGDLKFAIYSNCSYESKKIKKKNGKYRYKLVVDKQSCNYTPRTKSKRANFIE